jgi:hypothetical protein
VRGRIFYNNLSLKNHHKDYRWFYTFLVLIQPIKKSGFSMEKGGIEKKNNPGKKQRNLVR